MNLVPAYVLEYHLAIICLRFFTVIHPAANSSLVHGLHQLIDHPLEATV